MPEMDDLVGLVDNWQQLWLSIDDPAERAQWAAARADELRSAAERFSDLRARAVAELHVDGWTYKRIAAEALSGSHLTLAQKLVTRGRDVIPPARWSGPS
jgi:hypothetical protein